MVGFLATYGVEDEVESFFAGFGYMVNVDLLWMSLIERKICVGLDQYRLKIV